MTGLYRAVSNLKIEKRNLDMAIAALEGLQSQEKLRDQLGLPPAVPVPRKRGRKSMSPEERLKVSARFRAYWDKRRRMNSMEGGRGE